MHTKRRIFVDEDHWLMRRSIVEILEREADQTVCGFADEATEALAALRFWKPEREVLLAIS